jgi:perosamine synthetase
MQMTVEAKMDLPSDANASGRTFGDEELELLKKVLASGTLNCTKGTMVREFESRFAALIKMPWCRTTTSGTAAMHTAVAAIDPEPGDEIITTPITDMGAISAILYQTAIPVFADVDPLTYNVTAETIEKKITSRTKAVVVTHLFGLACDMDPIVALCAKKGLPIIEDCAQAFMATYKGRQVGTFGAVGAFSLQQGKHITTGEGGMVVANDKALIRRMQLFIDKAWGYGDPNPDHYFLAPNYRMTELQGAVALGQFGKLEWSVSRRRETAAKLREQIKGIPGIDSPKIIAGAEHVYWKYPLRVDAKVIKGGADGFGAALKAAGIFCVPRYIQKPAFECQVLRDRVTFGKSQFPYNDASRKGLPPIVYDAKDTPGTVEALAGVVVLPWNEKYEDKHVEYIARHIRAAAEKLKI